jgi:hypothetical protein
MGTRRFTINVTTDGSGNATVYSPPLSGKIAAIHYIKDAGANPFAAGVDFAITAEATAEGIWTEADVNATKSCYPRSPTHSNAGVAALYAAGGTAVSDLIRLSRDRVKLAITSGGATKVGQFQIVVDE